MHGEICGRKLVYSLLNLCSQQFMQQRYIAFCDRMSVDSEQENM
jgi:hypothetical protein